MAGISIRSWKGLFLLSMVVPMGLFAGFKLTGIISGPVPIVDATRLEPVVWNRERPYACDEIPGDKTLNTSYVGGDVALSVSFDLLKCNDDWFSSGPALVGFGVLALNASVPKGFIESVEIVYREAYPESVAEIPNIVVPYLNLATYEVSDGYWNSQRLVNDSKASLKAMAVGQPLDVYMGAQNVFYYLHSPYNYTHRITIEAAVTYSNGTVYKQLIQPVELVFGPDHNNSVDDAEEIGFGVHRDYVDNSTDGDPVDYFKIHLQEGQKVGISVLIQRDFQLGPPSSSSGVWFTPDIFVNDPNGSLEGCLLYGQNTTSQIVLSINQTGWWYIKATAQTSGFSFLYALDIFLLSTQTVIPHERSKDQMRVGCPSRSCSLVSGRPSKSPANVVR